MIYKSTIGIVGIGFLGSAIAYAMYDVANLILVDKDPSKGPHSYSDLMACEAIFICVPTPMNDDSSCNTTILEEVLSNLKNYTGVIISKCTAPPSVYLRLSKFYPNLVHSPEFLTAANALNDYVTGKFAIIGGTVGAYMRDAERIIRFGQPQLVTVSHCSIDEAALAKYAINSFLAVKVVFMNELYQLATASDLNFDVISHLMALDHRIGNSHMRVPGHDGNLGFAGMCFPKDTAALLKYAEQQGTQMNVLDAAVKKNILLRLTEPK
jgi:UDPglucose 6-dehydrogenase